MFSISLSIAFALGYLALSPKFINDLLLSIGLSNPLLVKALVTQTIQYVIPAICVFLILRRKHIRSRITLTGRGLWILRICNTVSIAYIASRLFAGLIPGGGPGFAVSQFSIVTIVPAIGISLLVMLQIARRSFGFRGLVWGIAGCALLLGTVPFRLYLQKFQTEGVWDRYCKASGDRYISKPVDFKVLQFRSFGEQQVFTSVVDQTFAEARYERVGDSLAKRGLLEEYEDIDGDSIRPPRRIYFANGKQEEPLTNSRATHSISISFPQSEVPGFSRQTMAVTDLKTGLVIAERNQVLNRIGVKKRVCGAVQNGTLDTGDFVAKALNLTPLVKQ